MVVYVDKRVSISESTGNHIAILPLRGLVCGLVLDLFFAIVFLRVWTNVWTRYVASLSALFHASSAASFTDIPTRAPKYAFAVCLVIR